MHRHTLRAAFLSTVLLITGKASAMTAPLCGASLTVPKMESAMTVTAGDLTLTVRPAVDADVPAVTALIHETFGSWRAYGLTLRPMTQSPEDTARHLLGNGYVATTPDGTIVATFSLTTGHVGASSGGSVSFIEGADEAIPFRAHKADFPAKSGSYLVFKKLAVSPTIGQRGFGRKLYDLAEGLGRSHSFDGMVVETVVEAPWLYDWYVKMGFTPIASHKYVASHIDTILMIKPF